jgi:glucose-6-phosphate 1-dehydrogenase
MSNQESDAIVFLVPAVTWLTSRSFPSLLRLVRDEGINVPIVGVAKSAWTLDDLRNRTKASLDKHGGADPESFQKLANLLRYVPRVDKHR